MTYSSMKMVNISGLLASIWFS